MGKGSKFLSNLGDSLTKPRVLIYLASSVASTLVNKWILEIYCFPALCLAAIHFFVIFIISLLGSWFSCFVLMKRQQTYATLLILSSIACLNRIFTLLCMYENTLIVHMVSKTLTVPFILLTKELTTKEIDKVNTRILWKKYIPLVS